MANPFLFLRPSLFAGIFSALTILPVGAADYYIAPDGNDAANGTTAATPWQSLGKVNAYTFQPGDQVLFKAGGSWTGELWPKGSGASGSPILLGSYGTGSRPLIDAQGVSGSAAIKLYNQEYWTIQGFEVTNWAATYDYRYGIWVSADDGLVKHGIHILDNKVRDIYASPVRSGSPGFYEVAGIRIGIAEPGRADDVLIQGNTLTNIVAEGIVFWGEDVIGGGMNWDNLSTRVVVRGNVVSYTAADGILILGTDNELVEYNRVEYVGSLGVPGGEGVGTQYVAGMWPTRHRDGLWQFNEVHHTKTWSGDGQGFDNDVYLQGTTVFQYNYSHDNEGGFILDCCWPDGGRTLARYNISINETVGNSDRGNAVFHNNVFYNPGGRLTFRNTNGNMFYNNVFWCVGMDYFNGQNLSHNVYYGGTQAPANDANALIANPRFVNPNATGALDGFKLQTNSPCMVAGMLIGGNGGRDYWGTLVSATDPPNRGADNTPGFYSQILTSVLVKGPGGLRIPATGTTSAAFTATARDQNGILIPGKTFAWSLAGCSTDGMALDSASGVLTVAAGASTSAVEVRALCEAVSGKASVTLSSQYYQYSTDFSSTQGPGPWYYQYWTGSAYSDMAWDTVYGRWKGNETYLLLIQGGEFHPGDNGDAALKWVAPVTGMVNVSGTVRKRDDSNGDGVTALIKKGGTTLWGPVSIAWNDNIGQSHDLRLSVNAGDALYFRVNRNASNGNDSTAWDPAIYYTPSSFNAWISGFTLSKPAPDADLDEDGLPNALEYVLGGDPSKPSQKCAPTLSDSGSNLVFTFQRDRASETPDISLSAEASPDLANWPQIFHIGADTASSSSGVTVISNGATTDIITVTLPKGTTARLFVRLKVSIPH